MNALRRLWWEFRCARRFVKCAGWSLREAWGFVHDSDMSNMAGDDFQDWDPIDAADDEMSYWEAE